MFKVDEYGKVTISLGGVCTLGCKHCYTTTKAFKHQLAMSSSNVMTRLQNMNVNFTTICISGDTDCFLDPDAGLDLIEKIVSAYTLETIMFTTRLIPSPQIIQRLIQLGEICRKRKQLFIPCVSVVSFSYPNSVELVRRVPSSQDRLAFLNHLSDAGLTCFLALRPTFPFSVVPKEEVVKIIDFVGSHPAAVLGEVLLVDNDNEIARRLHLDSTMVAQSQKSHMSFLEQHTLWTKCLLSEEVDFVREQCHSRGMPYFLRSMSAVNYLKSVQAFTGNPLKQAASDWTQFEIDNIFP